MDLSALLYEGEEVLAERNAQLIVPRLTDRPATSDGLSGSPSPDGGQRVTRDSTNILTPSRITVTNWRILARYPARMGPSFISIFWPTVERVERVRRGVRGFKVVTSSVFARYLVWGAPKLLHAIEQARSLGADPKYMATTVRNDPQRALSGTVEIGGLRGAHALLVERGPGGLWDVLVDMPSVPMVDPAVVGVLATLELTGPFD